MPNLRRKTFLSVKIALCALLLALLSFPFIGNLHAQNPINIARERLDQAKQDYSFQFSKYEDCRKQYITDRSAYITFQTATSKNTAFLTTKDCLSKVYDVYVSYLRYIKEQGNVFTWNKNDSEKETIFKSLDDEITYFQVNKSKVGDLQTLESSVTYSAELKTHITKTTYQIIQKALATYEVAESEAALEDFVNMADILRKFTLSKIDQNQYASFIANWDSEISDIRQEAESNNTRARNTLSTFKPQIYDTGAINSITSITKKTKTELIRSKSIFAEILKLI